MKIIQQRQITNNEQEAETQTKNQHKLTTKTQHKQNHNRNQICQK